MPGLESKRLFTLRTVEDTLQIRDFVEKEKPRRAVLAGGGFIGLELAENLCEMSVEVTIVQMLDQLLTPLDKDMGILCSCAVPCKRGAPDAQNSCKRL